MKPGRIRAIRDQAIASQDWAMSDYYAARFTQTIHSQGIAAHSSARARYFLFALIDATGYRAGINKRKPK